MRHHIVLSLYAEIMLTALNTNYSKQADYLDLIDDNTHLFRETACYLNKLFDASLMRYAECATYTPLRKKYLEKYTDNIACFAAFLHNYTIYQATDPANILMSRLPGELLEDLLVMELDDILDTSNGGTIYTNRCVRFIRKVTRLDRSADLLVAHYIISRFCLAVFLNVVYMYIPGADSEKTTDIDMVSREPNSTLCHLLQRLLTKCNADSVLLVAQLYCDSKYSYGTLIDTIGKISYKPLKLLVKNEYLNCVKKAIETTKGIKPASETPSLA